MIERWGGQGAEGARNEGTTQGTSWQKIFSDGTVHGKNIAIKQKIGRFDRKK